MRADNFFAVRSSATSPLRSVSWLTLLPWSTWQLLSEYRYEISLPKSASRICLNECEKVYGGDWSVTSLLVMRFAQLTRVVHLCRIHVDTVRDLARSSQSLLFSVPSELLWLTVAVLRSFDCRGSGLAPRAIPPPDGRPHLPRSYPASCSTTSLASDRAPTCTSQVSRAPGQGQGKGAVHLLCSSVIPLRT